MRWSTAREHPRGRVATTPPRRGGSPMSFPARAASGRVWARCSTNPSRLSAPRRTAGARSVREQFGESPLDIFSTAPVMPATDTTVVQPALFTQMAALGAMWRSVGVTPSRHRPQPGRDRRAPTCRATMTARRCGADRRHAGARGRRISSAGTTRWRSSPPRDDLRGSACALVRVGRAVGDELADGWSGISGDRVAVEASSMTFDADAACSPASSGSLSGTHQR